MLILPITQREAALFFYSPRNESEHHLDPPIIQKELLRFMASIVFVGRGPHRRGDLCVAKTAQTLSIFSMRPEWTDPVQAGLRLKEIYE